MKSASHTTLWIGAALGALALAGASVAQPPPNWDALRRTISERHF